MENYQINISLDGEAHHFEIGEYPHHHEGCKVKVFEEGRFLASFEPDAHNFLHVCQNPGNLSEDLLELVALQLEMLHPGTMHTDLNEEI
jgi:hypothetical protein